MPANRSHDHVVVGVDNTPDSPFIDAGMMKAYGQELLEKASVDVDALALALRVEWRRRLSAGRARARCDPAGPGC